MGFEDAQRVEQQVAEIRRVERFEPLLIEAVKRAALAEGIGPAFGLRHVVGREPAILPAVDEGGERARGPAFLVDILRRDDLLHQAQLVVGVEDGEIGFEPGQLGMAAQHPRRHRNGRCRASPSPRPRRR